MAPDDKPNRLAESGLQRVVTTTDREPNKLYEAELCRIGRKGRWMVSNAPLLVTSAGGCLCL